MADKIVVMQGGNIEQIGAPLDLYDRPANTFVAGFIGSPAMNMLEGTVRRDGGTAIEVHGTRMPVTDRAGLEEGRRVIVGIRPEHLEIMEPGLPATIAVVEPTGAETHVVAKFGTQELTTVQRARLGLRPGQALSLGAQPENLHIFDTATGARIP